MKPTKPALFFLGLLAGGLCIAVVIFFIFILPPSNKPVAPVPAVSTILPAQPIEYTPTPASTLVETQVPPEGVPADPGDLISIGLTVRITGTEGQGLRLRREAGKDGTPIFLGAENEVFEVVDGPESKDGFTWWYLKAPADASRQGWAVANYLLPVD